MNSINNLMLEIVAIVLVAATIHVAAHVIERAQAMGLI